MIQLMWPGGTRKICTMIYKKTIIILRGTIVNRTYGTNKNLYMSLFLLLNNNIFWSYLLWSPVIVARVSCLGSKLCNYDSCTTSHTGTGEELLLTDDLL